mmetsp:Transcript_10812/g.33786  ORF Transcript_10812/g.33786 Transcript_10812/m.33786 type:complete len:218 (+) Transcript_10812:985-1638(+)
MAPSVIGVVVLERLLAGEVADGLLQRCQVATSLVLDVQLEVVERLITSGAVVDVHTFDVVLHLALKEPLDGAVHRRALHLLLQPVAEQAVELLRIVLHEGVRCVPAKGAHELPAGHGCLARLQPVKEVLQSHQQRLRRPLFPTAAAAVDRLVARDARLLRRLGAVNGVDDVAEAADVEERLQQAVHVARRAMVLQPDVAGGSPAAPQAAGDVVHGPP